MEIKIVNIHEYHGSCFYVGRGSPLGNPFSNKASNFNIEKVSSREEAILKYENYIKEKIKYSSIQRKEIDFLVDKLFKENTIVLGCFCFPLKCHAEILKEIILSKVDCINNIWRDLF